MLSQFYQERMWCDDALRIMACNIFLLLGSLSEAAICSAYLQSLYAIGPSFPFSCLCWNNVVSG